MNVAFNDYLKRDIKRSKEMNYVNRIKLFRRCERGEKIMRDVLFRYENNSTYSKIQKKAA